MPSKSLIVSIIGGLLLSLIFGISAYLDNYYYLLIPIALALIYFALYYTNYLFLSLALLTPLSVNIEEYTDQFGLFIPTEPILFGLMLFFIAVLLKKSFKVKVRWTHPFFIIIALQLIWIFICCITSSHPIVSFKFLVSKLWFVLPMLFLGTIIFNRFENIKSFIWLFIIGMSITILYTVINHAGYSFGEKESHWVMSPFFKDHTIYGAAIALVLPFPVILYLSKKHPPLIKLILISFCILILIGLFFSYTRAAWLSVLGAAVLVTLVALKVNLKVLLSMACIVFLFVVSQWESIQMELGRNKEEHTTEQFGQRLQSAANVSTDASNLERINRWSCAIEMFKDRPVFGYGPGTFSFEYARFQEPENLTIISTNFGNLGNAHSEYLGSLSETGLPGLLLMMVFVGILFYKNIALVNVARGKNREIYILSLGILFSLSTYFIHGFLNNFLDTDKAAVPVFGMLAMIIAMEKMLMSKPQRRI